MPVEPELIQDIVQMEAKEETVVKEKYKSVQTEMKLLEQRYSQLSRFQVDNFIKDADNQIRVIDSFIEENDNQTNIHLRLAAKAVEAAEDANFERDRNPYHSAYREAAAALRHMFMAKGWENLSFEIQNMETGKLFEIVSQMKDTELEAQKLELERKYRETFLAHYETAIRDRDRQILALTRQIAALLDRLNKLGLTVPVQQDEADEQAAGGAGAAAESVPEPALKPELTRAERDAVKVRPTPKSKAKYLLEIHPYWSDAVIAEHAGVTPEEVKALRQPYG